MRCVRERLWADMGAADADVNLINALHLCALHCSSLAPPHCFSLSCPPPTTQMQLPRRPSSQRRLSHLCAHPLAHSL